MSQIVSELEISRRRNNDKIPNAHIHKVFGKDFEFSEKWLISDINPQMIKDSLIHIFKLPNKLTRESMKYVLREGARTNNVLRINEECFDRMVDSLWLPLDPDDERNYDEDDAHHDMLKVEHKQSEEKELHSNPNTLSSWLGEKIMSSKFLQAKEVLTKIYLCENEIFYSENSNAGEKNSKSHAVLPINLDPIKVKELKELKSLFKDLLKDLLEK